MEEKKNSLVVSNARMRKELQELEDQILFMLSNSTGNILDDHKLIETLATSKVKSQEITAKVKEAEKTEVIIDENRNKVSYLTHTHTHTHTHTNYPYCYTGICSVTDLIEKIVATELMPQLNYPLACSCFLIYVYIHTVYIYIYLYDTVVPSCGLPRFYSVFLHRRSGQRRPHVPVLLAVVPEPLYPGDPPRRGRRRYRKETC